jgi:peptidoglycan/LPS O-acetylase OafA/YrhL
MNILNMLLRKPLTLAEGLARKRQDNYLLLRHVAAVLLIYSHSYALAPGANGAHDVVASVLPGFDGGRVAVLLFFAISGFLVTSSYLARPQWWRFVWARVLRIYPAYVTCLALTVLITGVGFTTWSWREYFQAPATWSYLLHNFGLTGLHYTLPGAYPASAYPGVVNGSLWSLALEVRLYLYLAVLAGAGLLRWHRIAALAIATFIIIELPLWSHWPVDGDGKHALILVFAATAAAACIANYFPVATRILLLLIGVTWLSRAQPFAYGLTIACITYFSFWFAYRVPFVALRIPGDYSYGLFLYGFPVQQMLIEGDPAITPWQLTLVALLLVLLFAMLSWHLIEARALSLLASHWSGLQAANATGMAGD